MTQRKTRTTKADATRRQLLDAALAVIAERGYAEATVDRIVEVAGVSKGVAYYHFPSKAAIAESILVDGIGDLIVSFERVAAEAVSATAALTAMIELFAAVIFENAAFGRFFVAELWRPGRAWSAVMRGYEQRLLALLQAQLVRGQREGTVRPELDAAFESVALVGMVLTTTLYYIGEEGEAHGTLDERRQLFIARIVDFVHHANASAGMRAG
ncbi:TetR/AcrR family transcriptional regulator [Adlercreutzia sp. R7]|uniref:TetR/AcrR family transcriptional regulator n=1 Tax=Adlercreutzia wanghongyangiae TaxID=3111451 RepID=A0ABU6IK52_9ACTN|nr:TetR/AcrR family transcriptional regulator [Adlercreutzia sp. R7]